MSTRVLYASTLFGAMTLSAALDTGLLGERTDRRLLITSTNTTVPEIGERFEATDGFAPLRARFDDIVDWNDLIAPLHPSRWVPRAGEVPMLSGLLRTQLGLQDVSELVVESVAVAPARTIGTLIRDCPVTVYSDGLMSYGPSRDELVADIGRRAGRLLHLDLLPGVRPLLLRENSVTAEPIPDSAFGKVLTDLPEPPVDDAVGCPLIIGQYLSQLELLTPREEIALHADMLRSLAARGHRQVAFKPHPAAGRGHVPPLRAEAQRLGLELTLVPGSLAAESWFAAARPTLVISCFSTALLTAMRYFGIPAATMGSGLVLNRIEPYQNSNRIPATIVDATVPHLHPDGALVEPEVSDVTQLIEAVGYCMQAGRLPELRPAAADYLRTHDTQRYFARRRLERVGLVPPPWYRSPAVRRASRPARQAAQALRRRTGH